MSVQSKLTTVILMLSAPIGSETSPVNVNKAILETAQVVKVGVEYTHPHTTII